jgi:hypothetical protein
MPIHSRYYDVKDLNSSAPVNLSRIFKVGKTFNDIKKYNTLKRGDASFLTYTFKPTQANAKIRVYYMGVKEVGGKEIAKGRGIGIVWGRGSPIKTKTKKEIRQETQKIYGKRIESRNGIRIGKRTGNG